MKACIAPGTRGKDHAWHACSDMLHVLHRFAFDHFLQDGSLYAYRLACAFSIIRRGGETRVPSQCRT
jgi:hypothetical protein